MYGQDIGVDGSSIDSCFNIKERIKRIGRKGPEHCGYLIYSLCKNKLEIFRIFVNSSLKVATLKASSWCVTGNI